MMECMGYAAYTEVPIVLVNVQRVGPSTGMPTSPAQGDVMQAHWGSHGDFPIVVLAPGNVRECFDYTIKAFNISEEYRVPVIVLSDEIIGHIREKVLLPENDSIKIVNRAKPASPEGYLPYQADPDGGVPPMASFGTGFRYHVTGLTHDPSGFPSNRGDINETLVRRLNRKIEKAEASIRDFVTEHTDDCDVLIVAFGSSAMSSLSAVRQARSKGIKAGLFRPRTIWPFPQEALHSIAAKAKRVIVAEMNMGQIFYEVDRVVAGKSSVERLGKVNGELFKPEEILLAIKGGTK